MKQKTARGALVSAVAQASTLIFRTGAMMIMARLLLPADYGLVGMITAFTGFLGLFRDAGLSMAAIQQDSISQQQKSNLFWINLAVGIALTLLSVLGAPVLARFYGEPRLLLLTAVLGTSFFFNGAGAQHRAMLQRDLRFRDLAVVDIASLILSSTLGIWMASAGFGYWSLVGTTVGQPAVVLVGVWLATRWIPDRPVRGAGIRSLLKFGGTVTLNTVVVYVAYNADKVLLGRFWGAEALGVYGRAYQLISLPTENLNSTLGTVAFPSLARLQSDPARMRRYFLSGYSSFVALVMPITMGCALYPADIVGFFLGVKWLQAAPVFQLLAPTIIAFAFINPLGWLMVASGRAVRSLKVACLIAPVVILGYALGLRVGILGVAAGYSVSMMILVLPVIFWATRDTLISMRDMLGALLAPVVSVTVGALAVWLLGGPFSAIQPLFLRLVVKSLVLFGVYGLVLLFVMKQKAVYLELIHATGLWPRRRKASVA